MTGATDPVWTGDSIIVTADSTVYTADSAPPVVASMLGGQTAAAAFPTAVVHSGDDYAVALASLLPTGPAWPRDPDSDLMQLASGLGQIFGDVDARAAALLAVETDPRRTYEMLPEWERAFGLPEPLAHFTLVSSYTPFSFGASSFGGKQGRIEPPVVRYTWQVTSYTDPTPLGIPERREAVVNKVTAEGGQSITYFEGIAAQLGYSIEITEYRPFQFGLSSFGGPRGQVLSPLSRSTWRVRVYGAKVTFFRFGASSFGHDPILTYRQAEDLEAVLRRWKPAHTDVVFDYLASDVRPKVVRFQFGKSSFGHDRIIALA